MLVGWRLLQLLHAEDVDSVLQGAELASVVGDAELWDALFREALWMPDWPARRRRGQHPWVRVELRAGLRGRLRQRPQEQIGLLALLSAAPPDSQEARRLREQSVCLCLDPSARTHSLSWLRLPGLAALGIWGWEGPRDLPLVPALGTDTLAGVPDGVEHLHLESSGVVVLRHERLRSLLVRGATDLRLTCPSLRRLHLLDCAFDVLPPVPPGLTSVTVRGMRPKDVSTLNACPGLVDADISPNATGWLPKDASVPMPAISRQELEQLLQRLVDDGDLALSGSLEELVGALLQPLNSAIDSPPRQGVAGWLAGRLLEHPAVEDLYAPDEVLQRALFEFL